MAVNTFNINIVPKLHFRIVQKGLLNIQLMTNAEINTSKHVSIAVFYKYTISNKQQNNCISNTVKLELSPASLRNSYCNHLYRIETPEIQKRFINDNDDTMIIYLCIISRLEYHIKCGPMSSPIYLPIKFEKILTITRNQENELIEDIECIYPKMHLLIHKNISIILAYWISHFLNNNYSLHNIQSMILKYFPAKDGILHIHNGQTVKLFSDYEYEFESITIEYNGMLTVHKYDPNTNIGGKLLLTSLTNIHIDGYINLNGCGYRSYSRDYITGRIDVNVFKGIGYGSNCGKYGGHASYGTDGCFTCNCCYNEKPKLKHNRGDIYGDDKISILYLGSAGGNGIRKKRQNKKCIKYGKSGGGALLMKCNGRIMIKYGCISCNSVDPYQILQGNKVGYGSGGSIKIECNKFIFDPKYQGWWRRPNWERGRRDHALYFKSLISVVGRGQQSMGAGRICIKIKDKYYCGNDILDRNSCLRLKFYYDEAMNQQRIKDNGLNFEFASNI